MATTDQTINVPQLFLIIFLGGLAIRYFFFSSPSTSSSNRNNSSASNLRAREADVERIQQMFPQISRRSIMWDLQRNGGNVVATTERILSGRGLEVPPQSFQPPQPASASPGSSSSASSASKSKPLQPDLITRYNLKSKIKEEESKSLEAAAAAAQSEERAASTPPQKQAWSQNKVERQALLQKRREEMILAARRKMEARVKAEEAGAGS